MSHRKFSYVVITFTLVILTVLAILVIVIDPYFHYHAPLKNHTYSIWMERYQNDGIVKHFEYDAIVAGTSMVENFKTSEVDELFQAHAIKVPFAGAEYKEQSDNLRVALKNNKDIKLIVWGLDLNQLIRDKDADFHGIYDQGYKYPWFMIDENPFNDAEYILNKDIVLSCLEVLQNTSRVGKGEVMSFDEAYYWNDLYEFGKEIVLSEYNRPESVANTEEKLTDEDKEIILGNVNQNIVELVRENPDTQFYLFIPPYSICWWDNTFRSGLISYYVEALKIEMEELLPYNNVSLFAFWNNHEIISDLDRYLDTVHYDGEVNSWILQRMAERDSGYLITQDNYQEYLDDLRLFYSNYDYDSIFQ